MIRRLLISLGIVHIPTTYQRALAWHIFCATFPDRKI